MKKLNLIVTPHEKARAEDFNKVTLKIDEIIDAVDGDIQWSVVATEEESRDASVEKLKNIVPTAFQHGEDSVRVQLSIGGFIYPIGVISRATNERAGLVTPSMLEEIGKVGALGAKVVTIEGTMSSAMAYAVSAERKSDNAQAYAAEARREAAKSAMYSDDAARSLLAIREAIRAMQKNDPDIAGLQAAVAESLGLIDANKTKAERDVELMKDKIIGAISSTEHAELHVGRIGIAEGYTTNTDQNWRYTDFIPLEDIHSIKASLFVPSYVTNVAVVSFYTSDEPSSAIEEHTVNTPLLDEDVTIPAGARYARFCGSREDFSRDSYKPVVTLIRLSTDKIKKEIGDVAALTTSSRQIVGAINEVSAKMDKAERDVELTYGRIGIAEGYDANADTNWLHSDFIRVDGGYLRLNLFIPSYVTNVATVSFYTGGSPVDAVAALTINRSCINETIPIPEGVSYVRVSGSSVRNTDIPQGYAPSCSVVTGKFTDMYDMMDEISNMMDEMRLNRKEYLPTIRGCITVSSGYGLEYTSDANWGATPYINIENAKRIVATAKGSLSSNNVATITFYTESNASGIIGGSALTRNVINEELTIPDGARYIRMSGQSKAFGAYEPSLVIYTEKGEEGETEKPWYDCVYPKNIYLVCNDTDGVYGRQTSPAIYADHFFLDIDSEKDIRFSDGGVRQTFTFESRSDAGWNATLNDGKDVNVGVRHLSIGGDMQPQTFDVNVISTKASASREATPRVLVIGSSTVYGEGATYHTKGIVGVKPYHAICKELFMLDKAEQGTGNGCILLGTCQHSLVANVKGESVQYKDNFEGYRGTSISQMIGTAGASSLDVFTDKDGAFSFVDGWLAKYRTMDDNGVRLPWSAAGAMVTGSDGKQYKIGTRVTSEELLEKYNVCTPTHIVFHAGGNGGVTRQQLDTLIEKAKNDFPSVFVGLAMNDSMGTIFPSRYDDADASKCRWNITNSDDNRHQQMWNIQKLYESYDNSSWKDRNVFVLPFFFVSNPLHFASRESNLPENIIDTSEGRHETNWGWLPATHADVRAHANYAYQLYAWIKYTLSK